jgi:hypothetical protein
MSTNAKVITFGIICGLIWSAIATGFLLDSPSNLILDLLAGSLTGVIISSVLKFPLTKHGPWWTLFFGLASLPLGAFIYGVIFSIFNFSEVVDGGSIFNVFAIGGEFALISVISYMAVAFFPLAVLTTFILRFIIHHSKRAA